MSDLIDLLDLEREARAWQTVSTPAKLRKRLNEARSVLRDKYVAVFSPLKDCKLDKSNRRLVSPCGRLALQWQTRDEPRAPTSYLNQQTTIGAVYCIALSATEICAVVNQERGDAALAAWSQR